ncbi:MAG: riboflavin synthase [Bacteroidetes bacterium]|jgi:riboflavin synthase|nr:riboflavin synthase [Bacteroidota bacterium]
MFTGIIEEKAKVLSVSEEGTNKHYTIACSFVSELKADQSVAHNGVCLTVTSVNAADGCYTVTAIDETLKRTNLKSWKAGDEINVERGMLMNSRLDGHIVQGHVDVIAVCTRIENHNGSHLFVFENDGSYKNLMVEKGSVTVNGVSLTVVDVSDFMFSVAVIPYTMQHTTFSNLKQGDTVNIEFDIIGKYVARLMQ